MSPLRHTILGAFFFGVLLVLGAVTIYLGDFSFGKESHRYRFYFSEVNGLEKGSPVMVFGVERGEVVDIEFTGSDQPAERLAVSVAMTEALDIRGDYSARIVEASLLGGKRMDIDTGTGEALASDVPLSGRSQQDGLARLGTFLDNNDASLRRLLDSIGDITTSVAERETPLLAYLLNDAAMLDVQQSLAGVRSVIDLLTQGDGTLASLISKPDVHDQLASLLEGGNGLLETLAEGDGTLPLLLRDRSVYDRLDRAAASVETLLARVDKGDGLLGRLFSADSEVLYTDLQSTLASLRTISADLEAGKGALGLLLSDPDMAARIDRITANLDKTVTGVSTLVADLGDGQGALGALLADPTVEAQVRHILSLLGGALEDAREAAPISSFTSFLFGQV